MSPGHMDCNYKTKFGNIEGLVEASGERKDPGPSSGVDVWPIIWAPRGKHTPGRVQEKGLEKLQNTSLACISSGYAF